MTMQLQCEAAKASRTLSEVSQKVAQPSLEAMCKLTTICIENIYYLRRIVPEYFFANDKIDGVSIKKFKRLKEDAIVNAKHWISGTLDALRKGYFSMLIMTVYAENSPTNAIETYKINFKYNSRPNPNGVCDSELQKDIRRFFCEMKNLLTLKLKPLPTSECIVVDYCIAIQGAPRNYLPMHFDDFGEKTYEMDKEMKQELVAAMTSQYHSLRLRVKGFFEASNEEIITLDDIEDPPNSGVNDDNLILIEESDNEDTADTAPAAMDIEESVLEGSQEENIANTAPVAMDIEESVLEGSQEENITNAISTRKQILAPNTPKLTRSSSVSTMYAEETQAGDDAESLLNRSMSTICFSDSDSESAAAVTQTDVSVPLIKIDDEKKCSVTPDTLTIKEGNIVITCVCNTSTYLMVSIIKCSYCAKYAHAECYGIKKINNFCEPHCCVQCALTLCTETNQIKCTDPKLLECTRDELISIGLIRLALTLKKKGNMTLDDFKKHFAGSEFEYIFDKFRSLRILYKSVKGTYEYNMAKLNNFYKCHFNKNPNTTLLDLLENSSRGRH